MPLGISENFKISRQVDLFLCNILFYGIISEELIDFHLFGKGLQMFMLTLVYGSMEEKP